WFGAEASSPPGRFPDCSAEDKSIAMIASTFPADALSPADFDYSPFTTDTEADYEHTPAMPILPDMPTRSRRLLENLGSAPIMPQPARRQQQQQQQQQQHQHQQQH
ncbi:unnamed protein product, partial [Ixodes persulcatus]